MDDFKPSNRYNLGWIIEVFAGFLVFLTAWQYTAKVKVSPSTVLDVLKAFFITYEEFWKPFLTKHKSKEGLKIVGETASDFFKLIENDKFGANEADALPTDMEDMKES